MFKINQPELVVAILNEIARQHPGTKLEIEAWQYGEIVKATNLVCAVFEGKVTEPQVIPWVSVQDGKPESKRKYLTFGSYGITTAWFDPAWSNKFQDCETNNNECMADMDGRIYTVTHWMELPKQPEEKRS
ncbi:DUF551 domain-containing protein [Xenorhabdus lircayensis]|uniref:DUF551 domain-containing protein n=1 Tax=Xenorhabdus lircayensis TaxID=2763499 RepID=A0ABS0U2V6_9GAMM|nr:DUF551 domain-containing protein [Xenorhabdus lircayensis]MBI6547824.1 DUF551 domain-containing protein [Xenorhabdus lircayensis]